MKQSFKRSVVCSGETIISIEEMNKCAEEILKSPKKTRAFLREIEEDIGSETDRKVSAKKLTGESPANEIAATGKIS